MPPSTEARAPQLRGVWDLPGQPSRAKAPTQATTEACLPGADAQKQEKPLQ